MLKSIWGTSGADIFAMGIPNCWCERRTCEFFCLPQDCWLECDCLSQVCADGAIFHYDGSTWTGIYGNPYTEIKSVWGSSSTEIFAVGDETEGTHYGIIYNYDGKTWSKIYSGYKYFYDIWGSSGTDVFAVGEDGTIFHYDGTTWTETISGTVSDFKDVWGSSANDIFVVGNSILYYNGNNWSFMEGVKNELLEGVWGNSSTNVIAVGWGGTILHYDGSTWSEMDSGTTRTLNDIWGSSGKDVFAVGNDGTIFHYDGSNWSEMNSGTTNHLCGVWGSSATDVFAVGGLGGYGDGHAIILHYDGSTWSEMYSESSVRLNGIWGSSATNVFAVGEDGTILHYDGSTWSEMDSGTEYYNLNDVWGSSATDVYVVGGTGPRTYASYIILHYDGTTWSAMEYGPPLPLIGYGNIWDLESVWGSSATDVFAVGSRGTILHYDVDVDDDGIPDIEDNCPYITNPNQEDADLDGVGDVCDNCPETANGPEGGTCSEGDKQNPCISDNDCGENGFCSMNQEDADQDGKGDVCDLCPTEELYGEDSEETELLRNFRDNVLSKTPEGQELIRLYYQWSPAIVRAMDEDGEFKEEVKEMIDGILPLIGGEEAATTKITKKHE